MNYSSFLGGILYALYLFTDAPKHNKNRVLWAVLGFFFGGFALGTYLCQTKRVGWGIFWLALTTLIVVLAMILIAVGVMTGDVTNT